MRDVERLKLELQQAIKDSDEYKDFVKYKHEVEKNPDLMRTVNQLRRQNFELQHAENIDDMFGAVQEIKHQYDAVYAQNTVSSFLTAELCLCRMVQDICNGIVDGLDFGVDFLD